MPIDQARIPLLHARGVSAVLLAAGLLWLRPGAAAGDTDGVPDRGEQVFRRQCASCHGESGEGVEGKYSQPLAGDKSVAQLARFIEKSMPDDEPEACVGEDASAVARYIHDAFYSPIARARHRAARIELSRLTVRQYRNAVADLVGSFREPTDNDERQGLRGEYFNSRRPGRGRVLERIDAQVRFDFGRSDAVPDGLGTQGFSTRWEGSVIAPDTGDYVFTVRTDHAARLWLNDRDVPLIDAWVKSGDDTDYHASIFLLGGRAYPVRLEFTSRKQGVDDSDKKKGDVKPVEAFVDLCWKRPKRVREVIPPRHLSPARAPELFVVETPFPPDDSSEGYERGASASRAWDDATTAAAIETAGYVVDHIDELAGIRRGDSDRADELREFSRRFVERAFRRPLDDEQRHVYIERQFAEPPDLETAVVRTVILALKSPRFLYLDLPAGEADAWSVASRLSFALWDSLPDEQLLAAAASGRLVAREHLAGHVDRMIHDPRTRSKVRRFLHHWLGVDEMPDLSKDEGKFPGFDDALASDLRTSLDLFLDDVIWGERPDFRRLLLSNELYLNGRLAEYYGFDLPEDAPFRKLSAVRPRRVGVLSHPYLMARFAYTDGTSPIHRGVFLARGVMGRPLLPPPEAFTPLAADLHPDLTTRERVALQTRPDACRGCHSVINPLGFTLEHFDAVGRYREEENGKPIDAAVSFELASGEERTLVGAGDLAEFLAASEETRRAFIAQLFHHLVKQPILAYGAETPAELMRAFAASDLDVRALASEIAMTCALAGVDPASYNEPPPKQPRRERF